MNIHSIKPNFKTQIMVIAALCFSTSINAVPDLLSVYQSSLENDPTFKEAYFIYQAAQEARPQALSYLLPSLSATGTWSDIDNNSKSPNPLSSFQVRFQRHNYLLNASQPIFNYAAWVGLKQSSNAIKKAQAVFDDAAQSLMLRTATAYVNVLKAKDNVKFTRSEKLANNRSLSQAKERFDVGIDAIATVYEAQSAYDSSVAQLIVAKNNEHNQFENLRLLTNTLYQDIAVLKSNEVPLIKPSPANIDSWTILATKQNYLLKASQYAALAAKQNISINNAGHLPTVNLAASYNHLDNKTSTSNFLLADTDVKQASIVVNFPLFNGGLVVSKTRQASYNYQAAYNALERNYRSTLINTRIYYHNIINGISTIKANKQTLKSAKNSLESTSAQFDAGTRTMVDVVISQKNLYKTQMQLASDQYDYILALLQLKYQAGILSVKDLQQINQWLTKK